MFLNPSPVILHNFLDDDTGTVTPEYAIGMITATTIAVMLFLIARSDEFHQALTDLVNRALNVTP